MGLTGKQSGDNSLRAGASHQTVNRCGLTEVVRSLARAAARAWLTEHLKTNGLCEEAGRVNAGPAQLPPSEQEDRSRE
jgi:hypothetical protein